MIRQTGTRFMALRLQHTKAGQRAVVQQVPSCAADRRISDAADEHGAERRQHRRLDLRLPVELRRLGDGESCTLRTHSRNIGTGGIYIESQIEDFAVGDRLSVDISLPVNEGVSPFPGRATCAAKVLRVTRLPATESTAERFGMAAEFVERIRFSY